MKLLPCNSYRTGLVWFWVLLGLGLVQPQPCAAGTDEPQETWYVVLLGDQRAGHVHRQTSREADRITTETSMRVRVGRGDAVIAITSDATFVETLAGEPVRAESSLGIGGMGGQPITTTLDFLGESLRITTRQGDRISQIQRPAPTEAWLPPDAAMRDVQEQLTRGADRITVRTIDPAMGHEPFTMTMTIRGKERIELFGREAESVVWDAVSSNLPGVTMREYVDASGQALKSTVSLMPGMEMTVVAADRALALSDLEPPEIMAATLLEPLPRSVPILEPRRTEHAEYIMTVPADFTLPETPAQAIRDMVAIDDGNLCRQVRITVQSRPREADVEQLLLHEPLIDRRFRVARPSELAAYREPSPLVDFNAESVRSLLHSFKQDERISERLQDAVLAERLRQLVFETIEAKDLSVGFANATETAATRRGDCTEHAVLLAALLRSCDIPSRGVAGLVYVDEFLGQRGVFGFHMWTQAYLDPDGHEGPAEAQWVDLDAALDPARPFDATHIALVLDDLNAASPLNQLVALTPVMGRLEVRVIEAE
ncbi:MAG: transglutaminase domain-containing protein [Planctomycetota bacterium]